MVSTVVGIATDLETSVFGAFGTSGFFFSVASVIGASGFFFSVACSATDGAPQCLGGFVSNAITLSLYGLGISLTSAWPEKIEYAQSVAFLSSSVTVIGFSGNAIVLPLDIDLVTTVVSGAFTAA